uniref:Protein COFACTOR ASSEMBLY OF COMPLEX C SUBUNIT B CCB3, chloroplastic n=1 Tax=Opuntia streptacantha TaxID=393608 RepID=A0A7C9DB26_OPUST
MASLCKPYYPLFLGRCGIPTRRYLTHRPRVRRSSPQCVLGIITSQPGVDNPSLGVSLFQQSFEMCAVTANGSFGVLETTPITNELKQSLFFLDLDPATAKLVIPFLGPFLSAFAFLFILRIVMSWYPKLPVGKFPYVLAYAPTEPLLIPTRKVIPPLGGVDVTPVVWFGLLSFLNEILVGPQGLLVLLSQQT